MNTFSHVPPGFRFHPTDEELVDYYLRRKINCRRIDLDVIKDVDLYKIEPWDLQELCRIGTDDQNEWYFFSHKDKKYPTGTRTNRATSEGFWKATGRDKAIYSKHDLVGMRKTLVFYRGRAPNGQKSDWIMHEYRLETDENGAPQEEGWVVCRVFKKRLPTMRKVSDHDSPTWYDDRVSFMQDHHLDSPNHHHHHPNNLLMYHQNPNPYPCKKELDLHFPNQIQHAHYMQLPFLENAKILQTPPPTTTTMPPVSFGIDMNQVSSPFGVAANSNQCYNLATFQGSGSGSGSGEEQVTDWRVLDKFVASQLSHEDVVPRENEFSNDNNDDVPSTAAEMFQDLEKQDLLPENASTSTSSCPMDLWK